MERDEEMIEKIILMEKHFWEENVLGGIEPVPDGSEATTNYLSLIHIYSGKTVGTHRKTWMRTGYPPE